MISTGSTDVFQQIVSDPGLSPFVDRDLKIPANYCGKEEIKLIILGQDPTVKNERSRKTIRVVLNLDKDGSLLRYLDRICLGLGLRLDKNIFATNYLKNFFKQPPTQVKDIDILQVFGKYWLPVLLDELDQFPGMPVLALGEPLLGSLALGSASPKVRDYWGFTPQWKAGKQKPFSWLDPKDNVLGRAVFPFPHVPSIQKEFYAQRMDHYIAFVRQYLDRKAG